MKVGSVKINKTKSTTTSLNNISDSEEENKKNNRVYFNFINSMRSPYSRKTYEFTIKKYMRYYNIQDINELLANKDNPTIIENNIIDWLVALRDTVAYNTRCTYYAILMTFYEINDVNLRKKKVIRFLGHNLPVNIKIELIL